jgi:hypothetical protein
VSFSGKSLGIQNNLFVGVRAGEKSSIGFWGTLGNNNEYVTQAIVDKYICTGDTIINSYNPYYNI